MKFSIYLNRRVFLMGQTAFQNGGKTISAELSPLKGTILLKGNLLDYWVYSVK